MSAIDLAFAGFNPDRVDRLVARHGSVESVVRRLGLPAADRGTLERCGARFIAEGDPSFPEALPALPGMPRWLFVRGELALPIGVAVVGSRRATRYGIGVAGAIGRRLAQAGRPVISGLAKGVDGAAHRGCLESGGRAIAVLGSGIDVWYPARHRGLGEEVLASGGSVISEFPPGTPPEPWRFPARNRIIAGLSRVVVVVEAAVRSGALITARMALELGREVLAVPGDIDRPTSEGCNQLIRDGAHPVTDLDAVTELVDFVMGAGSGAVDRGAVSVFGVPLEMARPLADVVADAGVPVSEALAELGRMEAAGSITIDSGMVGPAG